MGTQNPSAPPHAPSAPADNPTRTRRRRRGGGIVHENTRHTTRFVVIGNRLVQHEELSLLAIGLGCHIQSLPTGAGADIKTLTARFKEGATSGAATPSKDAATTPGATRDSGTVTGGSSSTGKPGGRLVGGLLG